MNTDSIYHIGKDHRICEDYSLSGKIKTDDPNGLGYAVVCDGCSASPDVDIGARILAHSVLTVLENMSYEDQMDGVYANYIGVCAIHRANKIYGILSKLHPQALDATLLLTWVYKDKVTLVMNGDGVFIHKSGDNIFTIHSHLTSGAPDYLSYTLDKTRKEMYGHLVDNVKVVSISDSPEPKHYVPFEPVWVKRKVKQGDIIAVISDGIGSFRKQDNTPIDWKDLVNEFIGFKNTEGEFVNRRISAFLRKCNKEMTTHSDDISIASIVV
jgi:hypothetical protein